MKPRSKRLSALKFGRLQVSFSVAFALLAIAFGAMVWQRRAEPALQDRELGRELSAFIVHGTPLLPGAYSGLSTTLERGTLSATATKPVFL